MAGMIIPGTTRAYEPDLSYGSNWVREVLPADHWVGGALSLDLYQQIPVIIISTEGKEEDTIRGLKMGAKGYVKKPFQASELHSLIEKITGSLSHQDANIDYTTLKDYVVKQLRLPPAETAQHEIAAKATTLSLAARQRRFMMVSFR